MPSRAGRPTLGPTAIERSEMPKVSKETATGGHSVEGMVDDRSEELDGYLVGFTSFSCDIDGTPLMRGLPGDQCQCPHWGYVLKGTIAFRFDDREETYEAGDAYYVPPGHVPLVFDGAEILQFQPAEEMAKTTEVMARNMQAVGTPPVA